MSASEPVVYATRTGTNIRPPLPAITKEMRDVGCRTIMSLCDERADAGFSDWAEEVFTAMWEAQRP